MKGLLVLLPVLIGCGGAVLQGADALPPGEVPSGRVIAIFTLQDCVNGRGKPSPDPRTPVTVLAREDGKLLLVQARPGYDSLVVHNSFATPHSLTFQAISTPEDASPALHEYRIEWPSAASGKLTSSLSFEIGESGGGHFRAAATTTALMCRLVRKGGPADLDRSAPLRYEPEPRAPGNAVGAPSSITRQTSPWL